MRRTERSRRRWGRRALAGGLVVALWCLGSSSAFATLEDGALPPDDGTGGQLVMTGTGAGRVGVDGALAPSWFDPLEGYPGAPPPFSVPDDVRFAGLITARPIPFGPEVLLYCIDITTPTSPGVTYALGDWNEANVPNVGYVARLLNDYYPNTDEPASLTDPDDKAAAVQAAIWFFSDKYVLDRFEPRRAEVAAIVQNVIDLGPVINPPPPSLSITPATAEGPIGSTIGPFTLNSTAPAEVTATGGGLFADAAGTQPLTDPVLDGTQFWARRATVGDVDIQATASATVPTGNVYLPVRQRAQKLILAQTGEVTTTVHAAASAYDVGDLRVEKSVSGPGAGQRSAVAIAGACSDGSHGAVVYPPGSPPTPPLLVEDVRAGSECTVIELVDGANELVSVTTTYVPSQTVTIPTTLSPGDTTTVDVENVYEIRTGSYQVTKVVTGPDAGSRGGVVIDVACSDGTNESFTFPAGVAPTPRTIDDLPAGTTCTTTEPDDGGNPPTVLVDTTIDPVTPVTITAGETAEVVVSNLYASGVGSLVVHKDTEGLDELRGPVTIRAECDDGSEGEVTYPPGQPRPPLVLDNLPIGTECTITEPATGENALVDVTTTFDPGTTVTITAPEPSAVVRVTNDYTAKPGDVTVRKTISGAGAAAHSTVVVVVACEDGQFGRIEIPAGAPGPRQVTLAAVPAGDDCGVAELRDGSNERVTATVTGLPTSRFVLLPAEDRTIDIDNSYGWNPGALTVTKAIGGPLADRRGPVTLTIACSDGTLVGRTYEPGAELTPMVVDPLPAWTTCRIEEPGNGATTGVGAVTSGAPGVLTIAPGTRTEATVTNTFVEVEVRGANTTNDNGRIAFGGSESQRTGFVGLLLLLLGLVLATGARYGFSARMTAAAAASTTSSTDPSASTRTTSSPSSSAASWDGRSDGPA